MAPRPLVVVPNYRLSLKMGGEAFGRFADAGGRAAVDYTTDRVVVSVSGVLFSEPVDEYPSDTLVAQIMLVT